MKTIRTIQTILFTLLILAGCNTQPANQEEAVQQIPVIFDTDANNELDDQHALAYLLLNPENFQTVGITVNATWAGGEIGEHVKEANRIVQTVRTEWEDPCSRGANGCFPGDQGFHR